jgi:uncharacterized protein
MQLINVKIAIPEGVNLVLGQSHFIKTAEDLYEVMVTTVPGAKFGLAFAEASGPCLIRSEGNDADLTALAVKHLQAIGAGHTFCLVMRDAFPVNVLNAIKMCPEVCHVFCATANPLEVVVAQSEQGKGILGVIDGSSPKGVENDDDTKKRREFLRMIGYKR